ncbi:MAG: hypothetical protein ACI83I_002928, partial [Bacteroidia bacterium]
MMKRLLSISIILLLWSCSGEEPEVLNPYDGANPGISNDVVTGVDVEVSPTSIQGLHKNIFKPTCANSGCHDGNFEPDFRTIESSYNTLVNQPIIKNDLTNPLAKRVVPGNSAASMLIRRLEIDLNGNSGIMPLITEQGSDWYAKKDEYIANIKAWIDGGALNQRGDSSSAHNLPVQMLGMAGYYAGSQATRMGRYEPLRVPSGTSSVEIFVAFQDETLQPANLLNVQIDTSTSAFDFDSTQRISMSFQASPLLITGPLNTEVS